VVSSLSANVYLRYVFDLWGNRWRRREARGNVIILRYADDVVVGFEHEADARRFWGAMRSGHVTDLWQRTLWWRSQKDRMTWERMRRIAHAWLPLPRVLLPWPDRRFTVKQPTGARCPNWARLHARFSLSDDLLPYTLVSSALRAGAVESGDDCASAALPASFSTLLVRALGS
jgi:hypothetical protein